MKIISQTDVRICLVEDLDAEGMIIKGKDEKIDLWINADLSERDMKEIVIHEVLDILNKANVQDIENDYHKETYEIIGHLYMKKVYDSLLKVAEGKKLSVVFKPFHFYDGRFRNDKIALREGMSLEKNIIVLAHELAHAYLHYDKGDTINHENHCEYESQADRAAELLLDALSI